MAEYGIEKFEISKMEEVENITNLNEREKFYISEFNSLVPNGYNLTSGGNSNYKHSSVTIDLIKKKKSENVDNIRNPKLKGLPNYVAYRHNKKGEQILINNHPFCKSKTFTLTNYESFEEMKETVKEFINMLEKSRETYTTKNDPSLPKGVIKTKNGYRVNKIYNKIIYDKRFEIKKLSNEENKNNAIIWYNNLFQS